MVTAVLVDNGESTIQESIRSLKDQSIPVRIVLVPGSKTDMSKVQGVDKIYPRVDAIGRGRVNAILNEKDDIILSCDSDTIYGRDYARFAAEDLRLMDWVQAGTVLPRNWTNWLAIAEIPIACLGPYEFCLAFRKDAFLNAGFHLEDYSSTRDDISKSILPRMLHIPPDPRMICYTRLPTKGAIMVRDNYLPSILGVALPFGALGTVAIVNELSNIFKP